MNLIKINLLPYREIEEAKRKRAFNIILGIGAAAGVLAAAFVFLALSEMLDNQNARNDTLQQGIDALKKDLETIKQLETRKHNFLMRKAKVEELDNKRFEGARIIDGLNALVPEGVYLTGLKGNGDIYNIEGKALSDEKVAMFMRALPSQGVFDQATLISINKDEEANAQKFVLQTKLVPMKVPVAPTPPAAAPAPAPSSN